MNVTFEEPVHKILEKIKHKPYFRWPGKMSEDLAKRNQNLLHLSPRKGAYHRAMQNIKGLLGIVGQSRAFKNVCGQSRE